MGAMRLTWQPIREAQEEGPHLMEQLPLCLVPLDSSADMLSTDLVSTFSFKDNQIDILLLLIQRVIFICLLF